MTAKLRPEQRKLWRRIYLTAYESGANVHESCGDADSSVDEWEKRGAFDDELSPISAAFVPPFRGMFLGDMERTARRLSTVALCDHIQVAIGPDRDGYSLIALTEFGVALIRIALSDGIENMFGQVKRFTIPKTELSPA